jgi:hypothetical protein
MGENVELVVVRLAYGEPARIPSAQFLYEMGVRIQSTHRVFRATRGRRKDASATVLADLSSRMRRPHLQLRRAEPAVHPQAMCTSNASRTHSSA